MTNFLDAARRYGEEGEVAKFLRFTFDRDLSRMVRSLASLAPSNGFTSTADYRSWISEQNWFIEEELESAKQTR